MMHLTSVLQFSSYFQVKSVDRDCVYTETIELIRKWITKKFPVYLPKIPFTKSGKYTSSDKKVSVNTLHFQVNESNSFWAMKMVESDSHVPNLRRWITDIGINQTGNNELSFSIYTYYQDRPGYLGRLPEQPQPGTPKIVRMLIESDKLKCYSGSTMLSKNAISLNVGEVPGLANLLFDPKRKCPVVYLSCLDSCSGTSQYAVDPNLIAKKLMGNALVYYAVNKVLDDEFKYIIPPDYWCGLGAIRVYMPIADIQKDKPSHHRYLQCGGEDGYSCIELSEIIERALSRQTGPTNENRITSIEDIQREILKRDLSTYRQKVGSNPEEYIKMLEQLMDESNESQHKYYAMKDELLNKELQLENAEAQIKSKDYYISDLQNTIHSYKEQIEAYEQVASSQCELRCLPDSTMDVITYYQKTYPNRIAFTDNALKTCEASSNDPFMLWECLYDMVNKLYQCYFKSGSDFNPAVEEEYNNLSEYKLACSEGRQTKRDADLMEQRRDIYLGEEIDIMHHIKKGNRGQKMVRINFCASQKHKKIIVGAFGHLDNATSRKIK